MPIPERETVTLKLAITGTVTAQELLQYHNGHRWGASAIEAGGRIDLGTASSATVRIYDAIGRELFNAAITVDTDIPPVPAGVQGPIYVTVSAISNALHTLTVYWFVRK